MQRTISELLRMYDKGAISTHHLVVECLNMIDPNEPERVLGELPDDILRAILEFGYYNVSDEWITNFNDVPTKDQVVTATKWIIQKLKIRESGFYWIKIYGQWTIGEFYSDDNSWLVVGSDE
jgi:hypothetical protein